MTTNKKKKKRDRQAKRERVFPLPLVASLPTQIITVDETIPRALPLAIHDEKREETVPDLSDINVDEEQWEFV